MLRRLRVGSGPGAVDAVVQMVDDLTAQAGLDRGKRYWFRLAADEISTNITQHGYGDAEGVLDVTGWADDTRVSLQLEDDGPPFDPRSYDASGQLALDPAEREEGGLGLLLALRKLDDFAYDRVADRNRNTLTMWRSSAQEDSPRP